MIIIFDEDILLVLSSGIFIKDSSTLIFIEDFTVSNRNVSLEAVYASTAEEVQQPPRFRGCYSPCCFEKIFVIDQPE